MTTTRPAHTALIATGSLLALNGLVLGPMWLITPGEFSDTVASPAFQISQMVSWGLLTVLIPLVRALATTERRALPGWVVPAVQIALAMQAATAFTQALVLPWLLEVAPELLNLTDGGALQYTMTGIWVLFLVVMIAFAAALWRAGSSRAGAILMMIGALTTPVAGPIGAGLLGLGIAQGVVGSGSSGTAASRSTTPAPATRRRVPPSPPA